MNVEPPRPEFSRVVRVNEIGKAGLDFDIEADETERKAVAARLGVLGLENLGARIVVNRWRRTGARMKAQIRGRMTRRCVVTLEPFEVPIDEEFEVRFADPDDDIAMAATGGELILEPDSDDPPEILERGSFDAGEIVVQQLVLGLDPYPRKPGAAFEDIEEEPGKTSPFAVLSKLKDSEKDPDSGA